MTKEEKERKIKLIHLIMLVEREKYRRLKNPSFHDSIMLSLNLLFWAKEAFKISKTPTPNFPKGGFCYFGNNSRGEEFKM